MDSSRGRFDRPFLVLTGTLVGLGVLANLAVGSIRADGAEAADRPAGALVDLIEATASTEADGLRGGGLEGPFGELAAGLGWSEDDAAGLAEAACRALSSGRSLDELSVAVLATTPEDQRVGTARLLAGGIWKFCPDRAE